MVAEHSLSIAVTVRQSPATDGAGAGDRLQGHIGQSHSEVGFTRKTAQTGASMHRSSDSPHEKRRITAPPVAAGNEGFTRSRLVCIARGFHTSLQGAVTEGEVAR